MRDEHIDLLAQTMCAAFHADDPVQPNVIASPVWEGLSGFQRGNWRRAARAATRTLEGNAHWITPAGRALLEGEGK